jgi:hypothetical protein
MGEVRSRRGVLKGNRIVIGTGEAEAEYKLSTRNDDKVIRGY